MDFKAYLNTKIDITDDALERLIPKQTEYPSLLFEAMRYSIFAGGKRVRPVFLLAACEAVGGSSKGAETFAAAVEMIHTYSLIHDDLPAMDNDDYRRGRLTSHKKFGESIAILAGDALLHHAMEIMANACTGSSCQTNARAMQAIAKGAGVFGMVAGQLVDVTSEGNDIGSKTLEYIHKNKTAAMIQGALKAGGILGGGSEAEISALELIGEKIGVAFQIQDDILDVTGTQESIGKTVGSDEKNKKITYVTMYGLEHAEAEIMRLSNEAIELLSKLSGNTEFLENYIKSLIKRSR